MNKIKVSIIGATGFTGLELIRVLLFHPQVQLTHLVSRQEEGTPLDKVFPRLKGVTEAAGLVVNNTDHETVAVDSDVVFLCLPHVASQDAIDTFIGKTKVIDMSADFRIRDVKMFEKYYHTPHKKPELLNGQFVYGLPEIFREDIRKADMVANPGCFALLVQLMLLPFKGKMNHAHVIGVSGTSGGGRTPRDPVDHPFCAQNIRSYLVNEHRHTPEILATTGLTEEQLNFAPTVGPFLRGIFGTGFIETTAEPDLSIYKNEPFVRLYDKVEMTNVVSTNYIDLGYKKGHGKSYIVQGAIDNLLRGAAGTAVQNMNLMFGLQEDTGLRFITPVYP